MNSMVRVWQFFRPERSRVALALGVLVMAAAAGLLKPWPLALLVDVVLGSQPWPRWLGWLENEETAWVVLLLAGSIWLIHAGQGGLAAAQNYLSIRAGLAGLARVRMALFRQLQRLSMRFHQQAEQGDLIYRACWDAYAFQTLFQQGLFTLAQALLTLAFMLAIMWRLNGPLTLIALAVVPLMTVAIRFFARRIKERSLAAHGADSQVATLIQQTIAALPLIQSYNREQDQENQFQGRVREAYRSRASQHGCEVAYGFLLTVIFGLGTAGLIWFGAGEVRAGRLSVGELLVFIAYLAQLYEPLNQLSYAGATVSEATAGVQRVFELLDAPEDVQEPAQPRSLAANAPISGPHDAREPAAASPARIVFDRVTFGYHPDRPVLEGITFEVEAGTALAIVGPSGAGKTTLLQLLLRFYDPTSGAIRLGSLDLRELALRELRAQIAFVPQEPLLLAATIAENISYGKPDAPFGEIRAAAEAAQADAFIRLLPRQYETKVGEGGFRLSAGEKQRINLARAFLKDAPILILDEPTSALDAQSERAIVESLRALMRQRTTLVAAHRPATLEAADAILVLEQGRLTGLGPPGRLAKANRYYESMAGRPQA